MVLSCNNENATECFRSMGATVIYEAEVTEFTKIHVSPGIELVLKQGDAYNVTLKTGKNIREFISAQVVDGELRIENRDNCNWTRGYNSTTVYVTTPELTKITSTSQFGITSDGVLGFPNLELASEIYEDGAASYFNLTVDAENLRIDDNKSGYYVIKGRADQIYVNLPSGDSRVELQDLELQRLGFFHRSSNDIIAAPQQEAKGQLMSTGNLVLKTHPPVVEVEQVYLGSVVYN
ncbi:Putative auto-transporter adhesin, head GIN domain [Flavobacterium akiainvivens]|nr:Putative auto-transporter adhesin, head GIN domain [Flavobacterium akiainvivens]